MFEGAALGYGIISMFVLSSAERNRRAERNHSRHLLYRGWALMGAPFAGGARGLGEEQRAAIGT